MLRVTARPAQTWRAPRPAPLPRAADPARRGAALRTVEARDLTAQGPVETVQGVLGMFFRLPIFLNTSDPRELWG